MTICFFSDGTVMKSTPPKSTVIAIRPHDRAILRRISLLESRPQVAVIADLISQRADWHIEHGVPANVLRGTGHG